MVVAKVVTVPKQKNILRRAARDDEKPFAIANTILQNRVFNYRRKTTDTIKHTEAENVTSHFAARLSGVEAHA